MRSLFRRTAVALAACLTLLSGCGSSPRPQADSATSAGGTVTVFAAASLTEAFGTIGDQFEAAHPGTAVVFNFGSSATLAAQITQGAPADVFAAASDATMKTVTDAGAATSPTPFVSNTLEIAVPKGNPGRVSGLADFTDQKLRIALCAEQVPCGAAAAKVFAAAGLTPEPDTLEADVKAVLQKVQADEVDAALVYRTDVQAAGDQVEGIEFPEASQAVNTYPIAVLTAAPAPAPAQQFVDYVLSADGQAVLDRAGFGKP